MERPPEITLRRFEQTDADAVLMWASDPRVTRFTLLDPLAGRDEANHYLANTILPHPWVRAICVEGHPVGLIGVSPGPAASDRCRASVWYAIAHAFWGRGITTAAARMAVAEAFAAQPGLERLEAMADVENRGSQRVLEKTGFTREGVLRKYIVMKGEVRDMVMYSLLRSDVEWQ